MGTYLFNYGKGLYPFKSEKNPVKGQFLLKLEMHQPYNYRYSIKIPIQLMLSNFKDEALRIQEPLALK